MRHLSIMQRTAAIRKHLPEIAIAIEHGDKRRAENHAAIILDHLGEIDASCDILRAKTMVELGPK